jgi:hypothetical protein
MPTPRQHAAIRQVRVLFDVGTNAGLTDPQLLDRFATRNGEAAELAFAALVERHGPMVLRVCRGVLDNPDEAHDAFQATFPRKAARGRCPLAGDACRGFEALTTIGRLCGPLRTGEEVHSIAAVDRSRGRLVVLDPVQSLLSLGVEGVEADRQGVPGASFGETANGGAGGS